MATGNNPQLNIGPSKASQDELQKFLRMMEAVQRTVKATEKDFEAINGVLGNNAALLASLKQDMKTFKTLTEGMKRNSVLTTGPGSYFQGQQFRANRSAAGTARLGTSLGQDIAMQQELIRLAKQSLSFEDQKGKIQEAYAMNLRTQARSIAGINNLQDAQNLAAKSRLRIGLELASGETKRAESAARINTLAEKQVALLKQQAADQAAKQKAEAEANKAYFATQRQRISLRNNSAKMEEKQAKDTARAEEAQQQAWASRQRQRVRMMEASARLEERQNRRANTIQSNRNGDRELEQSQIARSWRMRNQAMTSNGGADLFGVQAQVMANYALMSYGRSALSGGIQATADLDESLRNLQAITVVTDENLASLKTEILNVSEATKFFATDISDAAVTLGQAGFSTKEIEDSIRAVALLATATGTDLARSVDLTTSIMGVFNMESSQMANVADTVTAAVNNSKLNIDKLALGMQYAGNTAAQSGVSFEELTASMGAMANAGIRSGSTLGTGMRQILIALEKPSGEFKASLDRLGLSMADIDLRSNGLYGVMKNLKEGGFTASDAIRSFEVRASAAFNALSGNLDDVVKLERAFLNSSAAMKANETQMRALSNQGRRFQANLQAIIATGLEPLVYAVRDSLKFMADMLDSWRAYPAVLRAATTGLVSLAAGFVAFRLAWLTVNVLGIIKGFQALTVAFGAVRTGAALTSLAFGPIGVVALGLAAAVGITVAAFASYRSETERVNDAVEKAQTAFDDTSGVMEDTASKIGMVDERIKSLTDRANLLNSEQNLLQLEADKVREQFHGMGLQLGETVSTTGELITALQALRGELANDYVLNIKASADALQNLLAANGLKSGDLRNSLSNYADQTGVKYRFRASGRGQFIDLADQARNPNATLTQLQDAMMQAASLQSKYLAEGTNSGERQVMENVLSYMRELIQLKQQDLSLSHQLNDLNDSAQNAEIKSRFSGPDGIVGKVNNFEVTRDSRITQAANSTDGGQVERYKAARAELMAMEEESKTLISAIDSQDGLNAAVREELKRSVENALATAQNAVTTLGESAKKVAEDAAEAEQIRRETEQSQLQVKQSKSENTGDIQSFGDQRTVSTRAAFEADVLALQAKHDQDTSTEIYKAELGALEDKLAQNLETIRQETAQHLGRVKNIEIQKLQLQQRELQLALDQAVTVEDKSGIRDQLADVAVALGEAQKERDALLIEGADALAAAQRDTDLATEEALAKLSEDNQGDLVKAAERDVEIAERALAAVEDLAQTAVTNKDIAEAQQARAKAVAEYAAAMNALAQIKTDTGDGTADQNATDARDKIDETNRGLDQAFTSATNRVNRRSRGGGGGNPYSKKRDYIDQMIDDLEAKLTLAENYLKAGKKVNTEYDDAMTKALDKAEEINTQIDGFQAKLNAGGLTVNEQKKLNELIDQQARLTSAIAKEEMRIAGIKLAQGQYEEGILLTTKAWARENLNLSTTLQQGITGALSEAKSSLSDFFTAWSDGTKSGKEAFRDMTVSILRSIQKIFAEMLTVYILQKALGWAGKMIGGNFGAELTSMAGNLREGGRVRKATAGTYVQGNLNRDSQRYDLMPGEYVLRRSAVQAIGVDELDRLNAMGNTVAATSQHYGTASGQNNTPASGSDVNIYLVDERSKAPTLGPSDVLAIISDDIARGGSTKKLIKTVQMGAI